eukprot:5618909-Pyramimonas_sp.AAC.1
MSASCSSAMTAQATLAHRSQSPSACEPSRNSSPDGRYPSHSPSQQMWGDGLGFAIPDGVAHGARSSRRLTSG